MNIQSLEVLCDSNDPYIFDSASEAAGPFNESEEWQAAFDSESERMFNSLHEAHSRALSAVFEYLKEECNLIATVGEEGTITLSSDDWNEALARVIESVNGSGMFHFESPEDIILSGPYDGAKGATLAHFHWHESRGSVYGEPGAKEIFNKELERYLS
jgi:hypothetical protein